MGTHSSSLFNLKNLPSSPLVRAALHRTKKAYRPATRNLHLTHLRTYLSFVIFMDLPILPSVHSALAFLEYLHMNALSHKVIVNYVSSLKKASIKYSWSPDVFTHRLILEYLRSVSINTRFSPTVRGIFDISSLLLISQTCAILEDPLGFSECPTLPPILDINLIRIGIFLGRT